MKMALLPKVNFMFNTVLVKIPMKFLPEIENSTTKSYGSTNDLESSILSKKSNARGITIPDLKLYYRDIAMKSA
jgi:hypothetical protein